MISADFAEDLEDLHRQFARWRNDQRTEAVVLGPLSAVQLLEHGNQKGQCLAAASLGGAENIIVLEGEGDAAGLNVGEGLEMRGRETLGRRLG